MRRKKKRRTSPGSDLADLMIRIRDGSAKDSDATEELRHHILAIGSATKDNLNCVKRIEIGEIESLQGPVLERGVKIGRKDILVSHVMGCIEDDPIPESVRDTFPRLTVAEWRACVRFVTLLLDSLQRDTWESDT